MLDQSPSPASVALAELERAAAAAGITPIVAPAGDATLTAAAISNSSLFVFPDLGFGHDTIARFDPNRDVIRLPAALAANLATVQADMAAVAGATVITLDPAHSITLDNVTPSRLTAANFRFG